MEGVQTSSQSKAVSFELQKAHVCGTNCLAKPIPDFVELQSIYKRLRGLDAIIDGEPIPQIDRKYLEQKVEGSAPAQ